MSLINVQSLITVQGDKLSKKKRRTGRKSSSISVHRTGIIFSVNKFTLTLLLYYFLLTGTSPIEIGILSLVNL